MTFVNDDASIRQFQMLRFVNENSGDEHVMSKISIVLRRDKIEAPYYMVVNTKLSTCIDRSENGLVHAMDMLNHTRRHNLTEEVYGEIESAIVESDLVKVSDDRLNLVLTARNADEFRSIFKEYGKLFEMIDSLVG